MKSIFATYDWKAYPDTDSFRHCPFCRTKLTPKEIDRRVRSTCPKCGFIHFKNPAPAVSILVVEDDRILLGKRSGQPGKGLWALPSGYIEFDEDFITAAIREVREETGLDVAINAVLHVESSFLSPQYHFLGIYLLAHVLGGSLAASDDLETVSWFSKSESLPPMAFKSDRDLIEMHTTKEYDGLKIE